MPDDAPINIRVISGAVYSAYPAYLLITHPDRRLYKRRGRVIRHWGFMASGVIMGNAG